MTQAVVIGGGPAGLMAAEVLAGHGISVDLFDAMPSVGRKFLLAGIGGMNITHAEPFDDFVSRYRNNTIARLLNDFGPQQLRDWIHALGIETFVGSSGRVFPKEMKAAPLLRAWLHRLRSSGVHIHTRHRWQGWDESGALLFDTREGRIHVQADTVVLALGGGSWKKLGSDGAWQPWLQAKGVSVKPLAPSNCGFECEWSAHFRERFAGEPVKNVALLHASNRQRGEFIVTEHGIEGSLVYAHSASIRDAIAAHGKAEIRIDLLPNVAEEKLRTALAKPRGSKSLSEHLRRQAKLKGVKAGLLREGQVQIDYNNPAALAQRIKSLPIILLRARPLDEAISSAGGVAFESLDENLMLEKLPGVFCAGEMLDWEAPTGGYLLTACFASGRIAGQGAVRWLQQHKRK
jgi:hypothetical protein